MLPTLRFYLLLALGTALALVLQLFAPRDDRLSFGLGMLLLWDGGLLILAAIDAARVKGHRVKITRHLEPRLSIGRENPVRLTVQTGVGSAELQITDGHPPELAVPGLPLVAKLSRQTSEDLSYTVQPSQRCQLQWGKIQVRQLGPWRLAWHSWQIDQPQTTKVYPDLVALRELTIRLALQSTGSMRMQRRQGLGTEFTELRDYNTGDDPRFIDWKATARRGRPLVRVLEPEQEQTLLILLDRGRLMTAQVMGLQRFDWAVNAALSLALAALHRGDRVGLCVFDRTIHTWIPPERGNSHLPRLLETITPIQPVLLEPDYLGAVSMVVNQQTRRSLVVLLTDIVDATASAELLGALVRLSPRYLPFCVTLRDPQIDRIAQGEIGSLDSAYTAAVALDLLAQRQTIFAQLKQKGVMVLDAPAPQISTQLVDRYLQVKARNRL